MGSVVARICRQKIGASPNLRCRTVGFVTWGGEFESQQRAMKRLSIIVPISIFLIFILLFNAFKSVKSALLILVNVPLGLHRWNFCAVAPTEFR